MSKISYRWVVMLAALALLVAACGPAGSTAVNTPGAAVPEAGTEMAPPAAGEVEAGCPDVDTAQLTSAGQSVYEERCASCHGAQGEGSGNFPALAGNTNLTVGDVAQVIQDYFSVGAHPQDLSPDDVAAVLTYARTSFGNTGEAVCPADVQVPATQ